MSVDSALEIFDIFGKDPVADERLTYAEVKLLIEDRAPHYGRTYGNYPLDYTTVDTSQVHIQQYLGVDSQAALDALFI